MNQVLDLYTRKVNDMKKEVNFIIGCHDEAKYIKEIERLNNEIKKLKSIWYADYRIKDLENKNYWLRNDNEAYKLFLLLK